MPLHIFLGDEVLLYFIVTLEIVEIQIWFEFKLVCNLQKGLKIYKGFSIFPSLMGRNPRMARLAQQASAGGPASVAGAHPSHAAWSDPLSVNPTW
jgi:hypothetical protein